MKFIDQFLDYINKKDKQSAINNTLRRAGVKKQDSQVEIEQKLINYVKNEKVEAWTILISDELKNNGDFMLKLYNARSELTTGYIKPSEHLNNNEEFVIEFLKIKGAHYFNSGYLSLGSISYIAKYDYKHLLRKPQFIEKLAEAFPDQNIIKELKDSFYDIKSSNHHKEFDEQILPNLSDSLLRSQAKKFGKNMLIELPKDYEKLTELIESAIECDNFQSLAMLNIDKVLENKHLIVKAFECCGKKTKALEDYINYALDPYRLMSYMCHGEPHCFTHFDGRYAKVQSALMKDSQIMELLVSDNVK